MGKLVLRLTDGGTREFGLERERTTIGRRADNDICLPYPAVSGEHAAVVTILDDSFLEDLNSTNGTLVNGKVVTKHFLRDRDEIDIGRQVLVYYSGESGEPLEGVDETTPPVASVDAARSAAPGRTANQEPTLPLQPLGTSMSDNGTVDTVEWLVPPSESASGSLSEGEVVRAPADAPTLEVIGGPRVGDQTVVATDEFIVGRLGVTLAALRRMPDGFHLVHLEGDERPRINGAPLPEDGSLLAPGDEIEIAGSRLFYRAAM